jgi:hypothetical protein
MRQPAQRVPSWLLYVLLVLALAGGAYYVWWTVFRIPGSSQADVIVVDPRTVATSSRFAFAPLPQGTDPGATLITLQLKNAAPDAAFGELAKLGAVDIRPGTPGVWQQVKARSISASFTRQAFWPSFFELCRQSGLYPNEVSMPGDAALADRAIIQLTPDLRNRIRCPAVSSGSCMIVLRQISHTATADLSVQKPTQHDIHVDLMLYAEPKLAILETAYVPDIEQAVDEAGNSLVPPQPPYRVFSGGGMGNPWSGNMQIRLVYPPKPARRIARLTATTRVIAAKIQALEIPDVLNAHDVSNTIDGVNVLFKGLTPTSSGYAASFYFSGGADPRVTTRFFSHRGRVRLVDAQGRDYGFSGSDNSNSPQGFNLSVRFSRGSLTGAAKLIVSVPTQIREIRVPFTFTDLPLP